MRLALNEGADVNATNSKGESALLLAFKHDSDECVNMLINAGADMQKIIRAYTPLRAAIRWNNVQCVRLLLNAGADANQVFLYNQSPLILAVIGRRPKCAELLINHGANLEQKWSVFTPLIFAAWKGMDDMVEVLIRAGADANHPTKLGTPLLVASRGGEAGGMKYVSYHRSVEMLLKAGSNVNSADSNGRTPLIACSKCCISTWTKLLLDSGADVNVAK